MDKMTIALLTLAENMLTAMLQKRNELNHHGGLGVMFGQKDLVDKLRSGDIIDTLFFPVFGVDQISRASSGDSNIFYNFPLTASSKLWQMVRTGLPSGPEDVISGETDYLGGVIVEWGEFYVFIVFSGAPQEIDVVISEAGIPGLPNYYDWESAQG